MSRTLNAGDIDPNDKDAIESQGYHVVSLIGKGAFGRVYQAYDNSGHEYAIKAVSFRKMVHKSPRSYSAFDEFITSKILSNLYYDYKTRQPSAASSSKRTLSGATKFTRKERLKPSSKRIFYDVVSFLVSNGIKLPNETTAKYLSCLNIKFENSDFYMGCDNEPFSQDISKVESNVECSSSEYEGVVIIYDVFIKNMSYFMVMERLKGETLEKYIRNQSSPLPEYQVKRYMFQVLKGMNLLWKNRIVHRDIKPDNIMFTRNDCKELKLIDIGLGRFVPPSSESDDSLLSFVNPNPVQPLADYHSMSSQKKDIFNPSKLFTDPNEDAYKTIENAISKQMNSLENIKESNSDLSESDLIKSPVGSPFYASPDITAGRGYTRSCDMWSLGMCFYFMVTGKDLVRKRPASYSREKKLIWERAGKKDFVLQDIYSPNINRILCSMLCKNPPSPEELLRDPWFDECRGERLEGYPLPDSETTSPSPQIDFNFRSC